MSCTNTQDIVEVYEASCDRILSEILVWLVKGCLMHAKHESLFSEQPKHESLSNAYK